MRYLAKQALDEIDLYYHRGLKEEGIKLDKQLDKILKVVKKAKKNIGNVKKRYRLNVRWEEEMIDYLEGYARRNKWMSDNGMKMLKIWANRPTFFRDPMYYELYPTFMGYGSVPDSIWEKKKKLDFFGEM